MEIEKTILRIDVIREMDTGKAFKMSWVTYDQKRGTGGELKMVMNWCKVKQDIPDSETNGLKAEAAPLRNPEHMANATVNIYNPNDHRQHITKVHWQLITFFNDKRVVN